MADYKINHMTGRLYKLFTTSPSSYYDYQVNRVQDIIEDIAYSESRTIFAAKVITGGSTNISSQASSEESESISTRIFNYLGFDKTAGPFKTYAVRFRFAGDDIDRNQIPDPNTALDPKSQNILISLHNYAVVSADIKTLSPGDLIEVREEDGTYYVNKKLDGKAQETNPPVDNSPSNAFVGKAPKTLSSYDKQPCVSVSQATEGNCYNDNFSNVKSGTRTGNTRQLLTFEEYKTLSPYFSTIREYIARHESRGDYEANNLGEVGTSVDTQQVFGKLITEMTMKEFRAQQNDSGGIIFASGKYQIIPETLRDALASLDVPAGTLYNEETQDALCVYLAITKRPSLGAYLMGRNDNLNKAGNDLSFEWAFAPLLEEYRTRKGLFKRGQSIYQGDKAGNKTNPKYVKTLERALQSQKYDLVLAYSVDSAVRKIIDKYGK